MSRPSKRTSPELASSRRMIRRAVVLLAHPRCEQAGDVVGGLSRNGLERGVDFGVTRFGIGAAGMEVTARRAPDQAGRRAGDRHELVLTRPAEDRYRLQKAPRVGVPGIGGDD